MKYPFNHQNQTIINAINISGLWKDAQTKCDVEIIINLKYELNDNKIEDN